MFYAYIALKKTNYQRETNLQNKTEKKKKKLVVGHQLTYQKTVPK